MGQSLFVASSRGKQLPVYRTQIIYQPGHFTLHRTVQRQLRFTSQNATGS